MVKREPRLLFDIVIIILTVMMLVYRVHFGIDFTDESWYVAEPYAVANMGLIPFVNNITQAPGFTIPLAFIFKLYTTITGSAEGIVLFSRSVYITLVICLSGLIFFIAKRYYSVKIPLLVFAGIVASTPPLSLFDINYNTIGLIYYPLILLLVFAKYDECDEGIHWFGFFSGALAVRAVIGTPQLLVGILVVFFYLLFQKKYNLAKWIVVGGISLCVIIFGYVIINWGYNSLYSWFDLLFSQGYFRIEKRYTMWDVIRHVRTMLFPFVLAILLFACTKKYNKNNYLPYVVFVSVFFIILGVCLSVLRSDYYAKYLSMCSWFLPFLYFFYTKGFRTNHNEINNIIVVCVSYLTIYFFAGISNIYGFIGREYWFNIPIIIFLLVVYNDLSNHCLPVKYYNMLVRLVLICFVIFTGFKLWCSYSYVYRDALMPMLDTRVESGIWRGIYTTNVRAKAVVETEQYLKSITNDNDRILCLDWASFGYLMVNGEICSITTLDFNPYSYKVNNPLIYYKYLRNENQVPTHIIYINYDKDTPLSIDDNKWKFNEFVISNYKMDKEYSNDVFIVKDYALVNEKEAREMVERLSEK